ncbi:MAG: M64 family metallopeptidase [Candidatus Diapherotrites archaeon]
MTISQNAQSDNALDIVLLSSNFNDRAEFISKVNELTLHIFSLEPFSRNKSKINIYAVFVTSSLRCRYDQQIDRYLRCDWSLATTAASRCASFDRALVLHREDRYGGAGQFWGQLSASYCGTYTSNSGNVYNSLWKDVAVHELAHTLGLVDEYVVNQNESATSIEQWLQSRGRPIPPYMQSGSVPWNCSTSNCSEWSSFTNIECTKGCSLNDWYRAKEKNSMMYDVLGGFSAPAENMVEKAIKYFSG